MQPEVSDFSEIGPSIARTSGFLAAAAAAVFGAAGFDVDGAGWRGSPGNHHADATRSWDRAVPGGGGVEDHVDDGRRTAGCVQVASGHDALAERADQAAAFVASGVGGSPTIDAP